MITPKGWRSFCEACKSLWLYIKLITFGDIHEKDNMAVIRRTDEPYIPSDEVDNILSLPSGPNNEEFDWNKINTNHIPVTAEEMREYMRKSMEYSYNSLETLKLINFHLTQLNHALSGRSTGDMEMNKK